MSTMTILADVQEPATALSAAVTVAGLAPSLHNTQPWRWRIRPTALELWADRSRQLRASDPDGRLLTLSCGAALHHAQVTLAALSYQSLVLPHPDPTHPDHLARIGIAGRIPLTAATMRLYHAIGLRSTDRRPATAAPMDENALLAITLAVQTQGCYLQPLRRDQMIELASTVGHAQDTQRADEAWRAEMARWVGGTRPDGTGIPDANIPSRRPQTTVPERDFGTFGTLAVDDDDHDQAAVYAILYSEMDEPVDRLRAGQALSAAWLTATNLGVAVMPLSAPIEIPATRQALRTQLAGLGYPQLVLRLGMADERRPPVPTPRLDTSRTAVTEDE
jgi:nitroreductase